MNNVYWLAASLVPMLGATVTLREGAAIGVCAIVMVSLHQVLLAPLRQRLANWAYVLASLLLLAALASCLQLALRAWLLPLAIALGHYPALLCLPCLAYDHLLPDQGRWRLLVRHLGAVLGICLLLGTSRQGLAELTGLHLASLAPARCYCSDCCWPCTIACVRALPTHVVKESSDFMNAAKRLEIFRRLHEDNPDPKTELAYTTPFELLVAVTLSAQSTDVGVNKATARLFPVANTPEAIHALGVEGLSEYIKTIGLYNSKAKNVIEACRMLIEQHGSEVPQTREALEALPGVGRKTANVVLNTAFRQPTMAVDTHIFRVSNRTGIAPGKTVLEVEKKLVKFVPKDYLLDAHHWLILHGRYVCQARKPRCGSCRIEDLCEYKHKTSDD